MYIPGSSSNLNISLMEFRDYLSDIFVELNFSPIAVGSTTFTAHKNKVTVEKLYPQAMT